MENKNNAYTAFKALENYLVTSESFYADNLLVIGKYINELEDKLSRRNMQIKNLKLREKTLIELYNGLVDGYNESNPDDYRTKI